MVLTILTIGFFAAIAFLAARLWRENRFTMESLSERQRRVLYGSVGLAFLAFAATRRMFDEGGFGVIALAGDAGRCSYGVYWDYAPRRSTASPGRGSRPPFAEPGIPPLSWIRVHSDP